MDQVELAKGISLIEQRLSTPVGALINLTTNKPLETLASILKSDTSEATITIQTRDIDRPMQDLPYYTENPPKNDVYYKFPGSARWTDEVVGDCSTMVTVKLSSTKEDLKNKRAKLSFYFNNEKLGELARGNKITDYDKLEIAQSKYEKRFTSWFANQIAKEDPNLEGWLSN